MLRLWTFTFSCSFKPWRPRQPLHLSLIYLRANLEELRFTQLVMRLSSWLPSVTSLIQWRAQGHRRNRFQFRVLAPLSIRYKADRSQPVHCRSLASTCGRPAQHLRYRCHQHLHLRSSGVHSSHGVSTWRPLETKTHVASQFTVATWPWPSHSAAPWSKDVSTVA